MNGSIKSNLVFALYALFLGAFTGIVTFLFLKLMNLGIQFLWVDIPSHIDFAYYPIVICLIGGLLVGITKKIYGNLPPTLSVVLLEAKESKRIEYKNLPVIVLCAFLPLIFGGSIGPEAGLAGILGGLCTWIGDHVKASAKTIQALSEIGMAATLGTIFGSPFFGVAKTVEEEEEANSLFIQKVETKKFKSEFHDTNSNEKSMHKSEFGKSEPNHFESEKFEFEENFRQILKEEESFVLPKKSKIYLYLIAAIAGFGTYFLLSHWFPLGGFYRYDSVSFGWNEILALVPLVLLGVFFAWIYSVFGYIIKIILRPLKNHKILTAILGGLALGILGMIFPYTLFSGEVQIGEMAANWMSLTALTLLLIVLAKLFLTRFCIMSGWRGGQIFPAIFAGMTLGYAVSSIFPLEPAFCAAIVSVSLVTVILKKPAATVILFVAFFPLGFLIPLTVAALISGFIPFPKFLDKFEKEEIEEEYLERKQLAEMEKNKIQTQVPDV
ncbi:chloride channel protein [Methanolapillus ohkumae]|uniref:Ion-transport protein YfeO n=1 Tax=Methanolapillus ohkumae TaxID=3028298 RepID=A0AA96ZVR0_9EURY|nr:Putative ion-transport protein YfeO [Methanosarcinaceae archaeon Am2]